MIHESFVPAEKSGKTLHLLKARSKPILSGRKRKKIDACGTYAQYKESKKKIQVTESAPILSQPMPILNTEAQEVNAGGLNSIFAQAKGKPKKAAKMNDD